MFFLITFSLQNSYSQTTLISKNDIWKYKGDGTNQGTSWRTTTFNDLSWQQGAAELGYGDAPSTVLTSNKITYYFRKSIATTSSFSGYTMKIRRDDGIVVYINGTEVYRNNMPTGTISSSTKASRACRDDGATVLTVTLPSSALIGGSNVICAEVHNNSTSSSDLTFELELIGATTIPTTCATPNVNLFGTTNITYNSANTYWTAIAGAISYNVQYRVRNVGASYSASINTATPNLNITGLQASTNYEFIVQAVCTGGAGSFSPSGWFTTTSGGGGGGTVAIPQFSHIVVVLGENTRANAVYGSSSAPYINSLANSGAKFISSFGLSHPSQPNYIQLFSGSNQGVTDNNVPSSHFTTPNIARELINAGKTFIHYSDGLPSVGYDGASYGNYRRRHNPLANWMGTGSNQVSPTLNQPFTAFPTNFNNLPSVSFVSPDLCNDGHDVCPPYNDRVKQYDAWVESTLNAYKQWCINNNSLLIVTYDEDDGTSANNIATVFYGARVNPGTYVQSINHYSVLRLLEDANALTTHAGSAVNAAPIDYCWTSLASRNGQSNQIESNVNTVFYPNPTSNSLRIQTINSSDVQMTLVIYDVTGKEIKNMELNITQGTSDMEVYSFSSDQTRGVYIIKTIINNKVSFYRVVLI